MAIKIEIEVEILSDGSVKLTTHGLKGASCEEEIKPIQKSIGKVISSNKTKEYYESDGNKNKVNTKTK